MNVFNNIAFPLRAQGREKKHSKKALRGKVESAARLLDSRRFIGFMLLAPALLYIVLLVGFPFLLAIAFGFSDVTVGNTDISFVGFRNFEAVWENHIFRQVFGNTVMFTLVSQAFILIFVNILAVIFTQHFTGKWFARLIFILPWATPVSLAAIGWLWMFDTKYSAIDYLLLQAGFMRWRG